jgi:hypothetical protein
LKSHSFIGGKENKGSKNTAVVSLDELRDIRNKTEKNQKNDAVIISKNELARIKDSTKITTKEATQELKKMQEEQKEKQMAASKLRKQKMVEMDKTRASRMPEGT